MFMFRLEKVQQKIDEILLSVSDLAWRRKFNVHLYGVAQCAVLLAEKRGLDTELAATIGLLHDISAVTTGNYDDHCELSANYGYELLLALELFSDDELVLIHTAIVRHDNRLCVDDPYDELLKDADVFQPYLMNPINPPGKTSKDRLIGIKAEFGLL